ncbi:MAG: coenzyme F420-0:L-glutamate ligase [Spirochaetales bacterium]|nr:coenzyme F420-0:L-glutamate ligase [Spirochaetales bacterium]MBR6060796.1 coenzyme F420-0:L-glutamate ligase [Spirochaetales bacterium]
MKYSGTISRGIRTPIIKMGDDLAAIVVDSVCKAVEEAKIELNDRDVVAITEAVVGISQGNYATADQIGKDVQNKFGDATVGLIFPIMSRNRFSMLLKGISRGCKKLIIQLSYPGDEVGNKLISPDALFDSGVNPYSDVFTDAEFKKIFPNTVHQFTGVDYIQFYKETAECDTQIILANDPKAILKYTDNVIVASIHERKRNKKILEKAGAKKVYCLDELLTSSVDGSGYNDKFGLLGSNLATTNSVKLFPRNCQELVEDVQARLIKIFNKNIEVMVYGDGAFKDPQGGIWELADPVVSPGFTKGLIGTPNELKLKYLSDNEFKDLKGEELKAAMIKRIKEKDSNLVGRMETQGTTPRQLTDLLGSLCDLTSGSGDKGTPVILIQNYFSNYANQ